MKMLQQNEKYQENMTKIQVGDWVTQYGAGYWKVLHIYPKYADEDYSSNGKQWRKGDRIGEWVILKKGFTAKMKPSNACDFVDAYWCKIVSDDIAQLIEATFATNPKAKEKFEKAPDMPKPSVASIWMKLSDEQAESFAELLKKLPDRFTLEEFWAWAECYRPYIVDPSHATYILYLNSYLWEISDHFEPLHFYSGLMKLSDHLYK